MADGFIVRKGGVTTEQALAPTITEVSTTFNAITFTIKNNDASTAVILYELDDTTPDANSIELAAGATSGNLTISGLADDTAFNVYATANVTGKVKSNVTEKEISTTPSPVFTAATGGTTLEYDLDSKRYRSHTFLANDDFVVSTVGDNVGGYNQVDYLIIAGGGGGGCNGGGGGGAGGYRTTNGTSGGDSLAESKVTVTATSYSVTIGAGGLGAPSGLTIGTNGSNSSVAFPLAITSTGGGRAASRDNSARGANGGSGGGGANASQSSALLGGDGISGQGRNGGNNSSNLGGDGLGSGGGGAFAVGESGIFLQGGNGGNGLANLLRTGLNETRGGGGGGGLTINGTAGIGGSGGGGNGSTIAAGSSNAQPGTSNTGSGGGGGGSINAGPGGSGMVIIRYEIAPSV